MSVEDYLNSIRKHTIDTSSKTSKLDSTMKDLLNYESLKRAVSDGVEDGNKNQFKRLSELSKKILTSANATTEELKETNELLRLYYSQLTKNNSNSNSMQLPATSWIQSLKQVLDEFGDTLPDKFQRRMKYDIVGTAVSAGADPTVVMQQLNMTQVNQTVILQGIFEQMKDQQLMIERKAEAEKPVKQEKEKKEANFWQSTLGKVTGLLGNILGKMSKIAGWAGAFYVAIGLWNQLSEEVKSFLKGGLVFKAGLDIKNFGKFAQMLSGGGKFASFAKMLKAPEWAKSISGKISSIAESPKLRPVIEFFGEIGDKIGDSISSVGKKFRSLSSKFKPLISGISKIGSFLKSVGSKLGIASKATKPILGILAAIGIAVSGPVAAAVTSILTAFSFIWDFIQGWINTTGGTKEKILGGLKRMVTEFLVIFVDIFSVALKGIGKLLGIFTGKKDNIVNSWGKSLEEFKGTLRQGAGYEDKKDTSSPVIEKATGTAYTQPSDIIAISMPHSSNISGSTPANALGINTQAGVILSSQSADFIKRAGLENSRITSGVRAAKNARDWTGGAVGVGTVSPRSHASGNKFDIGAADMGSSKLAETLGKLLKTPGFVQAGVEGPGDPKGVGTGEWYRVYSDALSILRKQGFADSDLSKIKWWGSRYASGKHIDVLIDPKKSGVVADNIALDTKAIGSALPENLGAATENPMLSELSSTVASALNEQMKVFEAGVKAPDQLENGKEKVIANAISNLGPKNSGSRLTFNKQNDIQDANLAALQLINLV